MPRTPRRYGQWAGMILFVVVAVLGAAYLYMAKGQTSEVLVLQEPVAEGQVLQEEALRTAQVSGVSDAVPVGQLSTVVGKRAAVALVPGQVLTNAALTAQTVPGPDERVVAVQLEAGRVPATLTAGTQVEVLAVPPVGDVGDTQELELPDVITDEAQVYAVQGTAAGSKVISLVVPDTDAEELAAYSAAGRVTVVQAPVGEG